MLETDPNPIKEDRVQLLKPGEYCFSFVVTIPEQAPSYNVWGLTFCAGDERTEQTRDAPDYCKESYTDRSANGVPADVQFTFPIPGFRNGQVVNKVEVFDSGSVTRAAPLSWGAIAMTVLMFLFVMRPGLEDAIPL